MAATFSYIVNVEDENPARNLSRKEIVEFKQFSQFRHSVAPETDGQRNSGVSEKVGKYGKNRKNRLFVASSDLMLIPFDEHFMNRCLSRAYNYHRIVTFICFMTSS